ncbi:MAG: hypothetical protein P8K80_04855 [Phycisphaerales bacterium]|nr:hypothetical protein [Phycisphaerales bacterium]
MNSKIKSASIVLTGGVLLGWGSSAALAANIVGVGMYGSNGDSRMSNDDASDAISYDENGYVMISYGDKDGITLENDNSNGELVAVNVDSQGSGYKASEEATQTVDNTGNTGVNATWDYEVDGTIGAYLPDYIDLDDNAAGNGMYGTGYISDVGANKTNTWVSGLNFRNDAGDAGPVCAGTVPSAGTYDTWVGATFSPGYDVIDTCIAWAGATADQKGEICEIFLDDGGVGYGAAGGILDVYVNGVLSTDYIGAYTTDAATGEILTATLTKNDAPVAGYPTNWDQVTVMPKVSTGTGLDYTIYLWGEYDFIINANFTDGDDCTQVSLTSHALEDVTKNNCSDCDIIAIIDGGEGCSITAGPIPVGAVKNASVNNPGFNYDYAPAVGIDAAGITAGSGATFTSVIGASSYYLTYEDGMPLEFDYDDEVSLYCGADYNNDDHADIVAHGTVDGYGETICLLLGNNGVVNEVVLYGESGTDWHIAGQLDRGGAEYNDGHCLLWRNNATGGNAVWVCNGDGVVEKSLIEAAAAEEWFCYCTNDSLGGGSRAYWYSHYGDNAMWMLDIDTDHNDWVTEMDYLRNDVGERVNTGTGAGWEMEAVGCLSGDPGDDNLSRDIVWSNAGTGAVCIWLMDQAAPGYINSRNYCTVGGNVYNGASGYGVAEGYRCIGVGQYEVDTNYGTTTAGGTLDREQMWGTLWWNHNGSSYAWKMDRTVDLELYGPAGNTGGNGLPVYPETVSAYARY